MSESSQHILLKENAKDRFINLGYNLISFDKLSVGGYRPDIILENDFEYVGSVFESIPIGDRP